MRIWLRQFCPALVPENEASVANSCFPLWLAYVKLIPLSEQEVEQLRADLRRKDTRRLYAHNDAWGYVSWLRPSTEAEIRRELEPYRDTEIYWEAGAGDRSFTPPRSASRRRMTGSKIPSVSATGSPRNRTERFARRTSTIFVSRPTMPTK